MRRLLVPVLVLGALAFPAVAQAAPVACFTESPAAPYYSGTTITFNSSCSSGFNARGWDLDNDGSFDDGTGVTASRTFATPGTYTVRLGVIDNQNRYDIESHDIVVNNRPPISSFTYSPAAPKTRDPITFTSTSTDADGTIASQSWDFDGDGFDDGTTAAVTKSFATPGTITARLRVVDNRGAEHTSTQTVTIANRAPTAGFTYLPASPLSKQAVTFTSASSDVDGTIANQAWEFDGTNDFNDGSGPTATKTFSTPGTYTVKLRVRDNLGSEDIKTATVTVANRRPTGSFAYTPSAPVAGDAVNLTATAADADGTIASQAWDLDNDGQFDDATGATASFTPASAGSYPVGLKVTDNSGDSVVATDTILVAERALPRPIEPPAGAEGAAAGPPFDITGPDVAVPVAPVLRWLDPFPVVRIRGLATRQGAKVTLLSVTGPPGATATLSCAGRGCPVKRLTAKVKAAKGKAVGLVRFRKMERVLPAGTRLEVAVTAEGLVGKYTRFVIRRLALPGRTDRCMIPGTARPATCPSTP